MFDLMLIFVVSPRHNSFDSVDLHTCASPRPDHIRGDRVEDFDLEVFGVQPLRAVQTDVVDGVVVVDQALGLPPAGLKKENYAGHIIIINAGTC